MISFANINKQYGKQLLFVDASFQLNPGEKVPASELAGYFRLSLRDGGASYPRDLWSLKKL